MAGSRGDVDLVRKLASVQENILARGVPLEAAMRNVGDCACALTHADGASIELVEGDDIVLHVATGSLARLRGYRFSRRGTLSGYALDTVAVAVCHDVDTDARVDRDAARMAGVRSMIVVPLVHGSSPLGVLKVSSVRAHAFDDRATELLRLLGGFVAAAMAQASAAAVRRSEETFRAMIEASPDAIFIHREGKVLYANPTLERLLGLSCGESIGAHLLRFVHPDDVAETRQKIARANENVGQAPLGELRIVAKGGDVIEVEAYGGAVEFEQGPARMVTLRDLRERKQVEAALERLRRDGVALVVHDLKSPLTTVVVNLEFVRDHVPSNRTDVLSATGDALLAAKRLDTLIATILNAGRLEEGHFEVRPTALALHGAVSAVLAVRSGQTDLARITTENGIAADVSVDADTELVRRVLENLFDNALRFTPPGGRIRFEAKRVGDRVELRVGNTGPAVPDEQRERIFEKFAKVGTSGRANYGLGLYFCKIAVEAHGGRIWVESTPELPTVFALTLPAS